MVVNVARRRNVLEPMMRPSTMAATTETSSPSAQAVIVWPTLAQNDESTRYRTNRPMTVLAAGRNRS